MTLRIFKKMWNLCALAFVFAPKAAFACAACYGQTDSPLGKGLNWGIFSLLVVAASVIGGITSFFVYIAKRSAATTRPAEQPTPQN